MPEFTCPVCRKTVQISEAQQRMKDRLQEAVLVTCSATCAVQLMQQLDAASPPNPPLDKSKLH